MGGRQSGDFKSPVKKKYVGVINNVCEVQLKIYFAGTAICHKLNIQEICGLKLQS